MKKLFPPDNMPECIAQSLFHQREFWMKISITFLFFSLLGIQLMMANPGYGQGLEDESVTLEVKGKYLPDVLKEIEKQTDYRFAYKEEQIKTYQVDLDRGKRSLQATLDLILTGKPLQYTVVKDKFIVLSVIPAPQKINIVSPIEMRKIPIHVLTVSPLNVKGHVLDQDGQPLIGVNILVKGTNKGASTDFEGRFALNDLDENAVLIVSYIGYQTQEVAVAGKSNLTITMVSDSQLLDEVVVTALGISREAKDLTYAAQKITGDEISKVKDMNYMNSLAGKVAGAVITKGTMGPGSSTRVLIRGNKSFTGSSTPLYVIDGVPSSLEFNPEDIESVQILPGAAAAALYGSRAANGVILITTRKGKKGVSEININSSLSFENAIDLPELQTSYGRTDPQYNDSWGEKISNGSDAHLDEFFKTGVNNITSISLSRGTELGQAYLSYSKSTGKGILPENDLSQHNFTIKLSSQFFDHKLSVDGSLNYVNRKIYNQNSIGGYSSITGVYSFPIDDDWSKYKGDNFEVYDPVRQTYIQNWPYIRNETFPSQNPYWVQNRNQTDRINNKYISTVVAKYQLFDWLDIQGRLNYDFSTNHFEKRNYASTQGTIEGPNGGYGISNSKGTGIYGDALLLLNKKAGVNFKISGIAGLSFDENENRGLGLSSTVPTSLQFPNFFSIYALNGLYNKSEYLTEQKNQAVFGSISVSYKDRIYIDVTGRNEWSSTVTQPYFYPSVGLGYVLKQTSSDILSFSKVRLSYSEVGNSLPFGINNPAPPYALDNSGNIVGRSTLPFFDGTDTTFLQPERTRSFEIGGDFRFFDNKLDLSLTYYNSRTDQQVFSIQAPAGSGAQRFWINGGSIDNRGIESVLKFNSQIGKIRWSSSLTFSHNKNRILELSDKLDADYFVLGYHRTHGNYLTRPKDGKYGAFGDVFGKVYEKNENGEYILNDNGLPKISDFEDQYIGNVNSDYFTGLNNTFRYKNFTGSFLIDSRFGGLVFNRTELWLDYKGLSKRTGDARDNGGVLVNGSLVDTKDFYLHQTGSGNLPVGTEYFFDATNIRLRELSLGHTFNNLSRNIGAINVSFIARNLFFIYRKAPFDPEVGVGSSPSQEGNANFVLPSTRSFGVSLSLKFQDNSN